MIIDSLLDNDFYKFTMMQAVYYKYPNTPVKYEFKWRNWFEMDGMENIDYFIDQIKDEINHLCQLNFKEDELEYLRNIHFIHDDFVDYLRNFKLDRKNVVVYKNIHNKNQIKLKISGNWLETILFEVPILAIISELYTKQYFEKHPFPLECANNALPSVIDLSWIFKNAPRDFKYGDFGTRRRASKSFQNLVINLHKENNKKFIGTSNVYFAKKYKMTPLGTQAHEWFQAHQQLNNNLIDSQKKALQTWADVYRGDLGIALSDCITFDTFLSDFDKYFAKLFDGCRHDSGCPYEWCEKLLRHYKKLGIDPKTKTAVFSDALDFQEAVRIFKKFKNDINISFGIGTYLTNNCGVTPPQIVIKMTECNNLPVAKISDSKGKGMCNNLYFEEYLKQIIHLKNKKRIK